MFDFSISTIFENLMDEIYKALIQSLIDFFSLMNEMGVGIFDLNWIKGIVMFFSYLGWSLYITGLVVSVFDTAIEYQNGRGSIRDTCLNAVKGFMAVSLFTIVPVELYKLSCELQGGLSSNITTLFNTQGSINTLGTTVLSGLVGIIGNPVGGVSGFFLLIALAIMIGYAIIRVFLDNLKRGGILLTMIGVGSLYMFSVPRGYEDGFIQWIKQVVGICLTAFLQSTILLAGLLTFGSNVVLGIGLMLSATEVPRIAGTFGLDTSTRGNMMSMIYSAQAIKNISKTVATGLTASVGGGGNGGVK